MTSVEAYPLHWPQGRLRTKFRRRANFHRKVEETTRYNDGSSRTYSRKTSLTIAESRDRVHKELAMLGASGVIISSNLELRQDGMPRSGQREPSDPGVAVYFQMRKLPHSLSCDVWDRAADNLAAIAKHVEAMRGQLRWGVADIATMFAGFKALPGAIITPSAMTVEEATDFISEQTGANKEAIRGQPDSFQACYRDAAKKLHPDANGGQERQDWHLLQQAAQALRQHHGI